MKKILFFLCILLFSGCAIENAELNNNFNSTHNTQAKNYFKSPPEKKALKQVVGKNRVKKQMDYSNKYIESGFCCKYCKKGKACGNSCISRSYTCHKPNGCACNSY